MPHREIADVVPSSGWVNLADLDRMASDAAERTATRIARDALKASDVEDIAEKVVERFLERAFDIPAGDNSKALIELRKDFTAMRAARETREALISHGLKAVIGLFATGICTAIWLAIKGAK
jgi:hypothetical protein